MPLDCNGGAALRVAPVKGPGPKLRNEFCRQVSPSQVRDAYGPHDANRQLNIHSSKSREVHYPWHPWHTRAVTVHEAFIKNGRAVFRCGIDEKPGARLLEIQQWMFDSVACWRTRLALLRCTSFSGSDVVLQGGSGAWSIKTSAHQVRVATRRFPFVGLMTNSLQTGSSDLPHRIARKGLLRA
jgi:hypothetical protein